MNQERESMMKAVKYISIMILFVLGSCSTGVYSGLEYDDLYYLPSDRQAVKVAQTASNQVVEGDLRDNDYYDNIYSADTLVSDEYSEAVSSNELIPDDTYRDYGYYDDYSYTGRLRRFHGNYFYPYWRDPFYYGLGFPSISYSYGYPYYYDPFFYDPFYYDYPYYGAYGYYPSFYSRSYWGGFYSPFYSSYYSPYYSNWGYFSGAYYNRDSQSSISYGRRERQSVYSTRWNSSMPSTVSSRRDSYLSKGISTDATRRSPVSTGTGITTDSRRTVSSVSDNTRRLNPSDSQIGDNLTKSASESTTRSTTTRTTTVSKPEYNSVNRSYTPSYNNPRMSTRPSYNNSRVSTERPASSYSGTNSNATRSSTSVSAGQSRSYNSNTRSTYSVPARRSSSSGSISSGSSRSSGSYSSGSTGTRSGGSYSSGSSSSSSSSSSSRSSSGSSSGGRR